VAEQDAPLAVMGKRQITKTAGLYMSAAWTLHVGGKAAAIQEQNYLAFFL
jgi:hypothetical protein